MSELRRARLNPKFGRLYPELPADEWLPAWQTAMQVAERLMRTEARLWYEIDSCPRNTLTSRAVLPDRPIGMWPPNACPMRPRNSP